MKLPNGYGSVTKMSGKRRNPWVVRKTEYSCAMKSHFRKSGNQMSGKWKSSYASLLA